MKKKLITNREVYEALETLFYNSLPQSAKDCDVSISEASCDKWTKEYDKFHELEREEFKLNKIIGSLELE